VKHVDVTPRVIGVGGHGKIFLAFDQKTGQQLACKVVPLEGVDIHQHRHRAQDSEASTDLDEDAPTQDTYSYRPKHRRTDFMRKIHQLEVEYDILKDLNHVRHSAGLVHAWN